MITIQKSQTADTRTCDFANTTKETLLASSRTHIGDVVQALALFSGMLIKAAGEHDYERFLHDWKALLKERGTAVEGAAQFPTKRQLNKADVLVLYSGEEKTLSAEEQSRLEDFVKRGGGLVLLHDAIRTANPVWLKTIAGGGWTVPPRNPVPG